MTCGALRGVPGLGTGGGTPDRRCLCLGTEGQSGEVGTPIYLLWLSRMGVVVDISLYCSVLIGFRGNKHGLFYHQKKITQPF